MELKLPEILSRYIAKQVIQAIYDNHELVIMDGVADMCDTVSVEDTLDILFPEDSDR